MNEPDELCLPESWVRSTLIVLLAATLISLAFGIWALAPYLGDEHRRIPPWLWVPMWLGDLSAFFWFVAAIVRRRQTSRTPLAASTDEEARRRRRRAFLVSMGFAMAADFGHTAYAQWRESRDFATADVVAAEAVAVDLHRGGDGIRYYVTVRFRDRANLVHQETIRVQGWRIETLPKISRNALEAGLAAFPVRVSYDADLPSRCWLTDVGWDDGDRIYMFSYLVLLFQALGIGFFAALLREQHLRQRDPWWECLQGPLPLMITGFAFLFLGCLELHASNLGR
jgi:hypothetical protein